MRSKILPFILSLFFSLYFVLCSAVPNAECSEYTVGEIQNLIDGIMSYKLSEAGAGSVNEWKENGLVSGAGTSSEWYIMVLSQSGYSDFSAYERVLVNYLNNNNTASASSQLKYALALIASGSTSHYIGDYLGGASGQQGIMSWIYSLHVINNGYSTENFNADSVTSVLLSLQYQDGGWALFGEYGDIDVTAMTISALAPYYNSRQDVTDAVNRALDFLSQRQKDDGGYSSFGTDNSESAAQVLTALSGIGIDCQHDERFIKNGNTVIDGIVRYRDGCGGFRHVIDGECNETATVQALYSLTAYKMMTEGRSPFFVFHTEKIREDNDTPSPAPAPETDTVQTVSPVTDVSGTAAVSSVSASESVQSTAASSESVSQTAALSSAAPVVSGQGSVTGTECSTSAVLSVSHTSPSAEKSYKPTAVIIILCISGAAALVLFAKGKRNPKNFIFLAAVTVVAVVVILMTDIRSADSYYSNKTTDNENITGTVSFEIRCDTIAGKADKVPENGIILDEGTYPIEEGYTVYDVLNDAARKNRVLIDCKGSSSSAYIAGINNIYEFDFGDLSGWVYHVNGAAPSVGCGEYVLSDGDKVEWLYTCNLGRDLGEVYE